MDKETLHDNYFKLEIVARSRGWASKLRARAAMFSDDSGRRVARGRRLMAIHIGLFCPFRTPSISARHFSATATKGAGHLVWQGQHRVFNFNNAAAGICHGHLARHRVSVGV